MSVFKRRKVFIESHCYSDYLLIFMFMNIILIAWGPQVNLNLMLQNDTVPLSSGLNRALVEL